MHDVPVTCDVIITVLQAVIWKTPEKKIIDGDLRDIYQNSVYRLV